MDALTIHQLQCFDAVVSEGGFQAGATKLHRSHSAVFTAIRNLESQLGLKLLDRKGYRVTLSDAGRSFHRRTRVFLHELSALRNHATQLAMGEETEMRIVIGDVCPLTEILTLLRRFFAVHPATRLELFFEAISGPWERLFDEEVDLIFHHIEKSDIRLEFIALFAGRLLPVVAPNFLPFPISNEVTANKCATIRNALFATPRGTALGATTISLKAPVPALSAIR